MCWKYPEENLNLIDVSEFIFKATNYLTYVCKALYQGVHFLAASFFFQDIALKNLNQKNQIQYLKCSDCFSDCLKSSNCVLD